MPRPVIMLIEDSRTQAEHLAELFRAEAWEVVCASTGESALDQLPQARPDLIVVDYHLPGMPGDEFCRKLRMNVNTRGIPVLMLTVEGTQDAEARGLESGADDYLAKSVDPDVLLLRVRALLRKAQQGAAILAPGDRVSSRARLLAIDDSPTYLQYLVQELSTESYQVEKAAGGQEALDRLEREPFDGILIDLEMPGIDGLEVCRRIVEMRRRSENPAVVLLLTAHEDKEFMTLGLESGADDFVGKSSDIGILKARVRALLRRKFFVEENRRILDEFKSKELEALRARAEKEAAEERARIADQLAGANRELEEANRKLQEALDVTRAITENAAEALFMLDAGGRITFVNPAAETMFGFSAAELLGADFHHRFHHSGRDGGIPASDCPLGQAIHNGAMLPGYEGRFLRKDGSGVDVACSNAPIVQDGQLTASVLVVHDISDQKRAEERLREAQKLESIGILAGGVAHDFNNILTSIIGNASIIEEGLPPEAAEKVRSILMAADKAADLTRQLLAYAGKGRWAIEKLDLSAVVRDILALVRLSIPKGVGARLELGSALPMVLADRRQMQQVIMNLVANAGEAIRSMSGGTITISTGTQQMGRPMPSALGGDLAPGRYCYLEVADTGCGLEDAIRDKIFDPFFTTKFTGRGLGLAAVAGIVRAQRGGIVIKSAPGAGSVFRVLLPACEPLLARP